MSFQPIGNYLSWLFDRYIFDKYMHGVSWCMLVFLSRLPGLVIAVLIIGGHSTSTLIGHIYPTAESGQRILLDTQLGLNKNLTAAEIQLIGPVLPILKADTSMDRDFILLEQEDKSILLYQYQSRIPIEEGVPMRFTWLADFDTILDAMAEANGIKDVVKNNPWESNMDNSK